MKRIMVLLAAMVMVFGFEAVSQASLTVIGEGTIGSSANNGIQNMVNGGYQLIYDSDQNITWLDYSAAGTICQNQINWANNLVVNFNGKSLTGWSLPTTVDSVNSLGTNPPSNSSQMAYLYFTELGNTGWPNNDYGLKNVGPFINLVSYAYWSAMSSTPGLAWGFATDNGYNFEYNSDYLYDGLGVLSGNALDIAPSPTPLPAAAYLLGSGLLALVGIRKKMQK